MKTQAFVVVLSHKRMGKNGALTDSDLNSIVRTPVIDEVYPLTTLCQGIADAIGDDVRLHPGAKDCE